MATTTAQVEPTTNSSFHCSAEWHLVRLGKYAVAIHSLMLRVQGSDHFFGSVEHIAEYFRADDRSIRKPLQKMVELGFVQKITARRGSSTVYRAVTHKEWADKHPGQCVAKRELDANPSQEMGEVTNSTGGVTSSRPDMHYPSQKMRVHPSQKMGGKSPIESPIKRGDTSVANKAATDDGVSGPSRNALKAAGQAYQAFCREMDSEQALDMLLWILYGAARAETIPQNSAYYLTAYRNFNDQHDYGTDGLLDNAVDRFNRYAAYFAEKCPGLYAWIQKQRKQIQTQPAEDICPKGADLQGPHGTSVHSMPKLSPRPIVSPTSDPKNEGEGVTSSPERSDQKSPEPLTVQKDNRPIAGFEKFWDAYPRKVAKPKAEKAARDIRPLEWPAVMAALEVEKKSKQWNRDEGQYIPHPATWLNQRRWEDVVQKPDTRRDPPLPHRAPNYLNGPRPTWTAEEIEQDKKELEALRAQLLGGGNGGTTTAVANK